MGKLWRWLFGCDHVWEEGTDEDKRTCKVCGERQWLFVRPLSHPKAGHYWVSTPHRAGPKRKAKGGE